MWLLQDELPPAEGQAFAWRLLREATAGGNAYVHAWQEGDCIVWDQVRQSRGSSDDESCKPASLRITKPTGPPMPDKLRRQQADDLVAVLALT